MQDEVALLKGTVEKLKQKVGEVESGVNKSRQNEQNALAKLEECEIAEEERVI